MAQPVIVNNPPKNESSSSGAWALAVIVVLVVLFFIFGWPRIRDRGTNINVPDKIEIDTQ